MRRKSNISAINVTAILLAALAWGTVIGAAWLGVAVVREVNSLEQRKVACEEHARVCEIAIEENPLDDGD